MDQDNTTTQWFAHCSNSNDAILLSTHGLLLSIMWSMCLNSFQEAWWEVKGKVKSSKSKPFYGYTAKAMHNNRGRKRCSVK